MTHRFTIPGRVYSDYWHSPNDLGIKKPNPVRQAELDEIRHDLMFNWRFMPIRSGVVKLTFIGPSKVDNVPAMAGETMKLLAKAGVLEWPSPRTVPSLVVRYKYSKKYRVDVQIRRLPV